MKSTCKLSGSIIIGLWNHMKLKNRFSVRLWNWFFFFSFFFFFGHPDFISQLLVTPNYISFLSFPGFWFLLVPQLELKTRTHRGIYIYIWKLIKNYQLSTFCKSHPWDRVAATVKAALHFSSLFLGNFPALKCSSCVVNASAKLPVCCLTSRGSTS